MANGLTLKEVKEAYIKLKSYVYYENFSIGLKSKIAEFESRNLEKKLKNLFDKLNRFDEKTNPGEIESYIKSIGYLITPKKFKEDVTDQSGGFYLSNHNKKPSYEIDAVRKLTPFIDCSVELHIITILWIVRIGRKIDSKLGRECYGNRLAKIKHSKTIINTRIKLFNRYYLNYNKWRDSAIKRAKIAYARGQDVAILNLDIQSYFNSIDLDLTTIAAKKSDKWLNSILSRMHIQYSKKLHTDGLINAPRNILPIGLISSNILANYYLASFDGLAQKKVNPIFYGRYVDDIIIVFANPSINKKSKTFLSDFIESSLCLEYSKQINGVKHICRVKRIDDSNFSIIINNNELKFQLSKVKLYHLYKHESIDVLDGFEKEIKKNSSEFKFQLETNDLIESFEDSSYEMTYGDTVNKLRSIEKFNANKFGASKHLSKLINGTKQTSKVEKKKLTKVADKILTFFSGKRALELVALWDKVFTFFVINRQQDALVKFSKHLLQLLIKIRFHDESLTEEQNKTIEGGLVDGLLDQLILAYAMASALDISFFNAQIIKKLKNNNANNSLDSLLRDITEGNIRKLAAHLIKSNLFRQTYLPFPLLNYCGQNPNYSFVNQRILSTTSFKIVESKIQYSPRFISYHEVEMFYYIQSAFLGKSISKKYHDNRVDFVYAKYLEFNNSPSNEFLRRWFPTKISKKTNPKTYSVDSIETIKRIRVGIVNIKINEAFTLESLKGTPILTFERLDSIHKVLNEAIRAKCQLVVFPEISVPFQWLSRLNEFSKKNEIGIVCGVEHYANSRKEAFNYVATILPFKVNKHLNSFLDLRLKIDYAPGEEEMLKNLGYTIPTSTKLESLRIFKWRNVLFTVLNCFELTDINKRIKFKGNVDFVVTVEYNRDISYFSSINESLARDLHCYVIQVNTSHYGDSRITLPADSFNRDYIKLKGGENISLVTGNLSISDLREFQMKSGKKLSMRKSLREKFKALPPNFEMSKSRS